MENTTRLGRDSVPQVAVIGAGMSGLVCARSLTDRGLLVTIFERSRGAGGRMATRRTSSGLRFDHGTQYFTVRDERFRLQVEVWRERGVAAVWGGRVTVIGDDHVDPEQDSRHSVTRYVGTPGMSSICRCLAEGLDVRYGEMIAGAWVSEHVWLPVNSGGEECGRFDALVVATPAPQASILLRAAPALSRRAADATMHPCWAVMTAFSPPLPLDFAGAFVHDSPLSWVARNSSKDGRPPEPDCWVLHGSPDWSQAHLEEEPETVSTRLLSAFAAAAGMRLPEPVFVAAHRWRYALPTEPLAENCLFDDALGIGACGDWCAGPRVEGAFLSGLAMAERVVSRFRN